MRGWLLDLYPSGPNQLTLWIIEENGIRTKLVDHYTPRIYVSGDTTELNNLAKKIATSRSVQACRFVERQADLTDSAKRKVLEIDISDHRRKPHFARKLLRLGGYERFQVHNVDIPLTQAYLYDKNLFPLAHLSVETSNGKPEFSLLECVEKTDYDLPELRTAWLEVNIKKQGAIPTFKDHIKSISLKTNGETFQTDCGSEAEKILSLTEAVEKTDPDIIFTRGGDSYLLPYLAHRAMINRVLDRLILSREAIPVKAKKGRGRTFFSYGRVYFKAPIRRLYGRIHVDVENTFIYAAAGMEGLIEVSRTCRVPLHRVARASIGSIMSSLQLYTAWRDGVLIPWKKREPESFKSAWDLLVADRGGLVFEPLLGIHEDVYEVDFTSMYPMLMLTRNISPETVLCRCCPNSKLKVPELGYHICEKRLGIVPKTLELLLRKRLEYKRLKNETPDGRLRQIYDRRQDALKWILVTCFGYLGYKNARFGRVDAHIAVCAYAREALLKAKTIAENMGFTLVHGIVDSLWLKKPGADPRELADLCERISKEIGVPLSVEGKYRWIVFLPSKTVGNLPVLNRYYGVFERRRIKVRGIEARRRDTPEFIREAQIEMLRELAKAWNTKTFKARIPAAIDILKEKAARLIRGEVEPEDLLIAKQLSKHPNEYVHDVFPAIAARQLLKAGVEVSAGKIVRYLIVNARSRRPAGRVLAAELIGNTARYDAEKYLDLLFSAGESLLGVFGYSKERLYELALHPEKQATLQQ
jgi:DNA polymerase elongation subunit (family B)